MEQKPKPEPNFSDQRQCIYFCYLCKDSEAECCQRLQLAFGENALKPSTIHSWYQRFTEGETSLEDHPRSGRPSLVGLSEQCKKLIEDNTSRSLRRMALTVGHSRSVVKRVIDDELHYVRLSHRWIPHSLTPAQKEMRVKCAQEMLALLRPHAIKGYRYVVTGDETWINHDMYSEFVWRAEDAEKPIAINHTIASAKTMITVFWNASGIIHLCFSPSGKSITASDFLTSVLIPLQHYYETVMTLDTGRHILLHMDNSSVHNSKIISNFIDHSVFKQLPQPPYSPDIAPSDFFLFGFLKNELRGKIMTTEREVEQEVVSVFQKMEKETFRKAFTEWIKRLEWIVEANGEYYKE